MSGLVALAKEASVRLADYAAVVDREGRWPSESLSALQDVGLFGANVPREYGGRSANLHDLVQVGIALGGGCLSTAMVWAMHCQQVDAVVRHGSGELKARLLPKIARAGHYLGSITTEVGIASRGLLSVQAPLGVVERDIEVVREAPIVTGGEAADGFLITMRDSESAGPGSVTLVYIDRADLSEFSVERPWDAMGMRGTGSVGLRLAGTTPQSCIIGSRGGFSGVASDSFIPVGHLLWSACWLGGAKEAFERTVSQIRSSRRGSSSLTETKRTLLARARIDIELVETYLLRVADEVSCGRAESSDEFSPHHGSSLHLNVLKVATSELSFAAVNNLMELNGLFDGYRVQSEMPIERIFRDLRSASINYSNSRLLPIIGTLSLVEP